jgi:hypothetical protein
MQRASTNGAYILLLLAFIGLVSCSEPVDEPAFERPESIPTYELFDRVEVNLSGECSVESLLILHPAIFQENDEEGVNTFGALAYALSRAERGLSFNEAVTGTLDAQQWVIHGETLARLDGYNALIQRARAEREGNSSLLGQLNFGRGPHFGRVQERGNETVLILRACAAELAVRARYGALEVLPNWSDADYYLRLSAEQSDRIGLEAMALELERGEIFAANYDEALRYWILAAEQGSCAAAYRLALAHQFAELGLQRNNGLAFYWAFVAGHGCHQRLTMSDENQNQLSLDEWTSFRDTLIKASLIHDSERSAVDRHLFSQGSYFRWIENRDPSIASRLNLEPSQISLIQSEAAACIHSELRYCRYTREIDTANQPVSDESIAVRPWLGVSFPDGWEVMNAGFRDLVVAEIDNQGFDTNTTSQSFHARLERGGIILALMNIRFYPAETLGFSDADSLSPPELALLDTVLANGIETAAQRSNFDMNIDWRSTELVEISGMRAILSRYDRQVRDSNGNQLSSHVRLYRVWNESRSFTLTFSCPIEHCDEVRGHLQHITGGLELLRPE